MTLQEELHEEIAKFVEGYAPPPPKDKKTEAIGIMLHEIFVWQELSEIADKASKLAWKALQDEYLDADDVLRKTEGETVVASTKHYTAIVKVDAPRKNFDRDTFIASVAAKFKLPVARVLAIAENAKKETAAPISKRVVCRT